MNIVAVSDIHIMDKSPNKRPDYIETLNNKLLFLIDYIKNNNIDLLLLAGDVFDTPFILNKTLKQIIELFSEVKNKCKIIAVFGQHDLVYHSLQNADNSPLAVFLAAVEGYRATSNPLIFDNIAIYGMSWGEQIPNNLDTNKINLLLAHLTVVEKTKLFEGQEEVVFADKLLKNSKYNCIITGDNHQRFITKYRNRYLINNGSVMRITTAQKQHKPAFTHIKITDKIQEVKTVYFPIKQDVFIEVERVVDLKQKDNTQMDNLMQGMKQLIKDHDNLVRTFDFMEVLLNSLNKLTDKALKHYVNVVIDEYSKEHSKKEL